MIAGKELMRIFRDYTSEILGISNGGFATQNLKHKGFYSKTVVFPMPIDPPNYTDFLNASNFNSVWQKGEIDLVTRFHNFSSQYIITVTYRGEKNFVSEFLIPVEAWSMQGLEYHFREVFRRFEDENLIKLTPQQELDKEYKEAKKEAMAKLYGAESGKFDMGLLKKEIEALKAHPNKWVVKGPEGNMHLSNIDESSSALDKIMHMAEQAQAHQANVNMSTFNQLKVMVENYYKEHGVFPEPNSFVGFGMKIAIDPGIPEGSIVFHTAQPPPQQKSGQLNNLKFKKPNVANYDNAGNELMKIIPALSYTGVDECPEVGCTGSVGKHSTLANIIIHLNDRHHWPRSGTDPNPFNKPNIADWIDEICLIYDLDQSFHPQKEEPKTVRDWAKIKKDKLKSKVAKIKDGGPDYVMVDEEFLDNYEKGYIYKEYAKQKKEAMKKNKPFPTKDNPIWKGMFDGA